MHFRGWIKHKRLKTTSKKQYRKNMSKKEKKMYMRIYDIWESIIYQRYLANCLTGRNIKAQVMFQCVPGSCGSEKPSCPTWGEQSLMLRYVIISSSRMVNSQASSLPPSSRVCAGCGGKISERFLLFSMDRYWHTRCLKCSCCQAHLGDIGSSCYSKGGMILCRSDYLRYTTRRIMSKNRTGAGNRIFNKSMSEKMYEEV